jgi:hypothetical protein
MRELFPLFFVAVFALVIAGIIRGIMRQFEIAELTRIGVPIVATVTEIERRTSTTTSGIPPHQTTTMSQRYCIHATWTDPSAGTTREYRSDSVSWWTTRRYAVGARITVLLDPHDSGRYYVDTGG